MGNLVNESLKIELFACIAKIAKIKTADERMSKKKPMFEDG